ncbi:MULTISPECIES: hypothetical protein [unclassified Sinorhizobium]|uniref:hypothetical protein n=1 Tax=unclassified Sinorhizobium TaxID=2613772 RepID=UPI00352479BE
MFFMERRADLRHAHWLAALIVLGLPALAQAQVTDEFMGKWSSDPAHCQQVNGEVDVLVVTRSGFEFYEVGCELKQPVGAPDEVRFIGQCYKGGSPTSSGTVVMRRLAPDKIDLALLDFPWSSPEPETFHRCRAG